MSKADAEQRLLAAIKTGEEQQMAILNTVASMVIRDRLVPPTQMRFEPQYNDLGGLTLSYDKEPELAIRIHRHALNQLAVKIHYPFSDVSYLLTDSDDVSTIWKRELLAHNFTERFHKEKFKQRGGRPPAFLHRLVGDQLRGFLSRSYNRHLASAPLLRAFIEACTQKGAKPIEATATDVKLSLKCFRPMIFEPVPGEFVAVGVDWSNSDFGSGRLTVSLVIYRVRSRTAVSLSQEISRVHLGSVIEESDIEMSDETMAKEVEAQASGIRDAVVQLLSDEYTEKLLAAITAAHHEEMSWPRLRGQLSKYLYKEELASIDALMEGGAGIVDLPPVGMNKDGKPLPTRWWASNVVSVIANKLTDERKIDLQKEAGKLLEASVEAASKNSP